MGVVLSLVSRRRSRRLYFFSAHSFDVPRYSRDRACRKYGMRHTAISVCTIPYFRYGHRVAAGPHRPDAGEMPRRIRATHETLSTTQHFCGASGHRAAGFIRRRGDQSLPRRFRFREPWRTVCPPTFAQKIATCGVVHGPRLRRCEVVRNSFLSLFPIRLLAAGETVFPIFCFVARVHFPRCVCVLGRQFRQGGTFLFTDRFRSLWRNLPPARRYAAGARLGPPWKESPQPSPRSGRLPRLGTREQSRSS
jgi:hypothetical protein